MNEMQSDIQFLTSTLMHQSNASERARRAAFMSEAEFCCDTLDLSCSWDSQGVRMDFSEKRDVTVAKVIEESQQQAAEIVSACLRLESNMYGAHEIKSIQQVRDYAGVTENDASDAILQHELVRHWKGVLTENAVSSALPQTSAHSFISVLQSNNRGVLSILDTIDSDASRELMSSASTQFSTHTTNSPLGVLETEQFNGKLNNFSVSHVVCKRLEYARTSATFIVSTAELLQSVPFVRNTRNSMEFELTTAFPVPIGIVRAVVPTYMVLQNQKEATRYMGSLIIPITAENNFH